MKGIYKITTPSNRVYIGQSVNIERRWRDHKWPTKRSVSLIGRSIKKHGHENHSFELVHELPKDVDKKTLASYESLYMDLYRSSGVSLLNIADSRDSNYGYKPSEESRKLQSDKMKGRPSHRKGQLHSEETRMKIKAKRAVQENIKGGGRKGMTPWNKGKKIKGHPVSEAVKEKIRLSLTGRKLSKESIEKRTATLHKNLSIKRLSEKIR